MPSDNGQKLSRSLLILALLTIVSVTAWATRAPAHPNSDRYDYAARARHLLDGRGMGPQLVYPLRFALDEVPALPPRNRSRAPLWPMAIAPLQALGLGARAGVVLSGALALLTVLWLHGSARNAFGGTAGGWAALGFATAFATARGIHGGGPEIALGLVLLICWTWRPAELGRLAHLACGTLYGILCLLHPAGIVFALLAFFARPGRYAPGGRRWLLLGAIVVALPWYAWIGSMGGLIQGQAELAKSLFDSGGLGPYRTLQAESTSSVLTDNTAQLARTVASRLYHRALQLDSLLPWTAAALAAMGMLRHPRIAIRDLLALLVAATFIAAFSWEFRLWVPLLPIAAAWVGAGASRVRSWAVATLLAVALGLGWWVPLGRSPSPRSDYAELSRDVAAPDDRTVDALDDALLGRGSFWTESAVLAFRADRPAVFLPRDPDVLARLRRRPVLENTDLLALGHGMRSPWTDAAQSAWDSLFARCDTLFVRHGGAAILRLPSREAVASSPRPVGPGHPLAADEEPDSLVTLPSPPASREGIELHPVAWSALERLLAAASDDGFELRVISGYRSHAYQTTLYERAVENHGEGQRWVARPGESEHQLGMAADLADAAMRHVLEQSFGDAPEGRWLRENVERFDFRITYTPETAERLGIVPEPWHICYVGPIEGAERP